MDLDEVPMNGRSREACGVNIYLYAKCYIYVRLGRQD